MHSPSCNNRDQMPSTIVQDVQVIRDYQNSQVGAPVRTISAFHCKFSPHIPSIFIRFPVVEVDWAISAVLVLVIRPPSQPNILEILSQEMALLLKVYTRMISNSTSLNLHHESSTCSLVLRKHFFSHSTGRGGNANITTTKHAPLIQVEHIGESTGCSGAEKVVKETT